MGDGEVVAPSTEKNLGGIQQFPIRVISYFQMKLLGFTSPEFDLTF